MDPQQFRREYNLYVLNREDLDPSPFEQFRRWLTDAAQAQLVEPNAIALATASAKGKPSCRMVLMKRFDEEGLVFYTNLGSRKSKELQENPYAAATIFWKEQERQVQLEGPVEEVPRSESAIYFASRPWQSQLGSWASPQGKPIQSREILERAYAEFEKKYSGKEVPLPPFWGGFRIRPERFEFWQGRKNRLSDRFEYLLEGGKWKIERLAP